VFRAQVGSVVTEAVGAAGAPGAASTLRLVGREAQPAAFDTYTLTGPAATPVNIGEG